MAERPLHALTLFQPWATLLVSGEKKYEPRIDVPPEEAVGQPIAIYAADRPIPTSGLNRFILEALERQQLKVEVLPLGAIIAIATLHQAQPAEEVSRGVLAKAAPNMPPEMHLGDFEYGKFVWRFGNLRQLKPVHCSGELGYWRVSDPTVERVRAAYRAAEEATDG